jgi:peptide/nickel transport system permease protein
MSTRKYQQYLESVRRVAESTVHRITDPFFRQKVRRVFATIFRNNMAKVGILLLLGFVLMALFAPVVAPNNPDERVLTEDGSWDTGASPSLEVPLGTTAGGYPLFSRLVYGSRVALLIGLLTSVIVGGVGTAVGITAGYYGGYVENVFMRIVDTAYGLPFLPFAIVLVLVLGKGPLGVVVAISAILWRGTARVVRSEVISIKEQPMIDAAIASGASDRRILAYHILPKVLPITMLYSVFAIGWAIMAEAGLSFLGFGNPDLVSWGFILNNANSQSALRLGLWEWLFAPGIFIILLVLSTYFIAQGIEEVVNPQLRSAER